jgi:hypothetical protein
MGRLWTATATTLKAPVPRLFIKLIEAAGDGVLA